MRLFTKIYTALTAVAFVALLTAAIPAPKSDNANLTASSVSVTPGTEVPSYKEMAKVATEAKGSKLTLKEKIALKVFGKAIKSKGTAEGKSQVIALILVALLGGLGIHRFYLGYTWQGVVQLLTLGGCGIWALIDLVRIITGSLKPKDGEYATTL